MNFKDTSRSVFIETSTKFDRTVILKDETQYVFNYTIKIINGSSRVIQLISRAWLILNARNDKKTVKGQGVIGKQPVLEPGQSFTYSSWCPLNTEIGKMKGQYVFKDVKTGEMFNVRIPDFTFHADFVNS